MSQASRVSGLLVQIEGTVLRRPVEVVLLLYKNRTNGLKVQARDLGVNSFTLPLDPSPVDMWITLGIKAGNRPELGGYRFSTGK